MAIEKNGALRRERPLLQDGFANKSIAGGYHASQSDFSKQYLGRESRLGIQPGEYNRQQGSDTTIFTIFSDCTRYMRRSIC